MDDLTIAIPAYNEGKYIGELLEHLVKLPYKIIISDNASIDTTGQICENYQKKFSQITYYRQPENIGAFKNYEYCLENADSEFFMFIGGHDLIQENYIKELLFKIKTESDSVLAFSPVKYFDGISKSYEYDYYEYLKSEMPAVRILTLNKYLTDCSLFYGVFRTEILKKAFKESFNHEGVIGLDHIILCNVAKYGKFIYSQDTTFLRRQNREPENILEAIARYLKFLYTNTLTLENIYFDFYEGMREGQLEVLQSLTFAGDIYSKNFLVEIGKDILNSRFNISISTKMYTDYLIAFKERFGYSLYKNYLSNKNIGIFGTARIAELLYSELKEYNTISCFIDNNKKGKFMDVDIVNESKIKDYYSELDVIVVSIEGTHDIEIINRIKKRFNLPIYSWKNFILMNEVVGYKTDEK